MTVYFVKKREPVRNDDDFYIRAVSKHAFLEPYCVTTLPIGGVFRNVQREGHENKRKSVIFGARYLFLDGVTGERENCGSNDGKRF